MSEDKGLDELLASLPTEAEVDAERARAVSGARCQSCGYRAPDADLAGKECPKGGCSGYMTSIARTELRVATCDRCRELFLWRYDFGRAERFGGSTAPGRCRACELEAAARYKETVAAKQRKQAVEEREHQRAAAARFLRRFFARFKPREK